MCLISMYYHHIQTRGGGEVTIDYNCYNSAIALFINIHKKGGDLKSNLGKEGGGG